MKLPPLALVAPSLCPRCDQPAMVMNHSSEEQRCAHCGAVRPLLRLLRLRDGAGRAAPAVVEALVPRRPVAGGAGPGVRNRAGAVPPLDLGMVPLPLGGGGSRVR